MMQLKRLLKFTAWRVNDLIDSKYCYPGTNVLINKFNIKDPNKLHAVERDITDIKTSELKCSGIKKPFNFDCLKHIHKVLFSDLYPFAGKVRDVDISKGNMFCRALYIEEQAGIIFRKLQNDNYLIGLDKNSFINKLADYMADVNALHPFREGNGRTQRIFFEALAKNAGYDINFAAMNKDELLQADIEAMCGNTSRLKDLLSKHCIDLFSELEKKIQSGLFTPEDVEKYNTLQAQRHNKSVESIKDGFKYNSINHEHEII